MRATTSGLLFTMTAVLAACAGAEGTDGGADAARRFDADVAITGCPGARPTDFDGCLHGDDYAECGGTGAPVFACRPDGTACWWFLGGCVPTSLIASPCAADDLCCLDDWPFHPDTLDSMGNALLYGIVQAAGQRPPDLEATTRIAVVVDPELAVTESRITCTEDRRSFCPPDPALVWTYADRSDDSLTIRARGQSWEELHLEVSPFDSTRARACLRLHTDAVQFTCPAGPLTLHCAESGELTISELSAARSGRAALSVRFEGRFGDLGVVTLEAAVPAP